MTDEIGYLRLRDGLAFHLHIEHRIAVGCIGTGVTQPMADGDQIDAGFEHMDGRAMAHTMRMEPLCDQRRCRLAGGSAVAGENVAYSEARQRLPALIDKNGGFGAGRQLPFGTIIAQQRGGL